MGDVSLIHIFLRFDIDRSGCRAGPMDRPLFVDNRHADLVDILSHQTVFFQAMLAGGGSDLSSLVKRKFEERDPEFSNFLVGIFNFTRHGVDNRLDYPIHDYEVVSRAVLHGSVASTSWPALPVTFFIAGAYIQHHEGQRTVDWSPDNMLIWFVTYFAAHANNDRFVTRSQRRILAGPSEHPAVSLVVRLFWQAAHPGSASADADAIARWFSREGTAPLSARFLPRVELAPRRDPREESESGARATGRELDVRGIVDFGQHGNAHRFMLAETWNAGEADFCWGKSPVALFAFTLQDHPGPVALDVDLILRDSRPDNVNRVAISCNGMKVYDQSELRGGHHRVHVPLGSGLRTSRYTNIVGFHAPSFRPSDYAGDDNRDLGVAVQRLWIHGWA